MGRPKGSANANKGQKRKRNKDPNKPKRATTAYFFFLSHQREVAKKEGRETNRIAEFTKAVSEQWKALSDSQKKPFDDKAAKDRERYQAQMAAYSGKDPNKPKKAQSAYFLFLGGFRAKHKGEYAHKDILKKAGEVWNGMTEAEKKPFEEMHEKEKAAYEEKMKAYNAGGSPAKKAKVENNGAAEEEDEEEEEEEEEEDDEEDEDDE